MSAHRPRWDYGGSSMPSLGMSDAKLERIAVIVTHGVGEAEPGQCTASLVQALGKEPSVVVEPAAEVLLLPDGPRLDGPSSDESEERAAANTVQTFPVLLRHATILRASAVDVCRIALGGSHADR